MNATTTSSHLRDTRDYPGLSMLNEVKDELDPTGWDERMAPEILAVRVDIYVAVRLELYMAVKKWDLVADISYYLVEKYPEQPQWWVHWANALKEMGKVEEAKKIALRGLKRHPDLTVFHFNLACYDSLLGKFRSARKRLDRLIRLNPRFQVWSMSDPDLAGLWDRIEATKVGVSPPRSNLSSRKGAEARNGIKSTPVTETSGPLNLCPFAKNDGGL